jgi:hypothetical protein
MDAVYIIGLLAVLALFLWAAKRDNEVFRVAIRDGRITVLRGKVPPSFMADLREIARPVKDGTVRAVKSGGEAQLVISSSVDERTAQRLRNAFALYPAAKRL